MRGPIVYCLESPDVPDGVDIDDIAIVPGKSWTARWEPALLGGVTVLHGDGVVRPPHNWQGQLYQRWDASSRRHVPVTLIPYYAWANRGESRMTVWLPVGT